MSHFKLVGLLLSGFVGREQSMSLLQRPECSPQVCHLFLFCSGNCHRGLVSCRKEIVRVVLLLFVLRQSTLLLQLPFSLTFVLVNNLFRCRVAAHRHTNTVSSQRLLILSTLQKSRIQVVRKSLRQTLFLVVSFFAACLQRLCFCSGAFPKPRTVPRNQTWNEDKTLN